MNSTALFLSLLTAKQEQLDASHLQYCSRVTLEFPVTIGKGASNIKIFAAEPPTTGSQFNPRLTISLTPTGQVNVPDSSMEEKSVEANSSDGKLPLAFRQWKQTSTDITFSSGANGIIRYEADLYYQKAPTQRGSASGGSTQANAVADYKNSTVTQYFSRNGITADMRNQGSPIEIAAYVMPLLTKITYRFGASPEASAAISSGVGDCGAKSTILQAALMFNGVPARTNLGWLIRETGVAELHCQPEVIYNGWWISLEPTGYRAGKDPYSYMGVNGSSAPHLFTLHSGFQVHAEFKDRDGQPIILDNLALQYPIVTANASDGSKISVTISQPRLRLSK